VALGDDLRKLGAVSECFVDQPLRRIDARGCVGNGGPEAIRLRQGAVATHVQLRKRYVPIRRKQRHQQIHEGTGHRGEINVQVGVAIFRAHVDELHPAVRLRHRCQADPIGVGQQQLRLRCGRVQPQRFLGTYSSPAARAGSCCGPFPTGYAADDANKKAVPLERSVGRDLVN
jgi:hypothetical protein